MKEFFLFLCKFWKTQALDKDETKFINKVEEIVPIFDDLVNEILDTSHIYYSWKRISGYVNYNQYQG